MSEWEGREAILVLGELSQEKGNRGISEQGGHRHRCKHTHRQGMGGAVGDGRGSRGWGGSREWEGQWGMGGVVGNGRGSGGWEG